MKQNIQTLPIASIRRDSGAQFRVGGLNEAQVESLIDAIENGAKIPAIIAFYDGTENWMADGDHRIEAHLRSGKTEIEVDLREGSQDDAIFYGTGANADHGLPRSPKTKRAQVLALLEKWPHLGVSGIAKQASVSRKFVYQVQNDNPHLLPVTGDTREYTDKHGNKSVMNVGNMTFKKDAPQLVDLDPSRLTPIYESPEFQAQYPMSALIDAGVKFEPGMGYVGFNRTLREDDPVDPKVALRIGIAPDIVEGFYSLGVMWCGGETTVLKEPEPPQMLVARLFSWGIPVDSLKDFDWKGDPLEETQTVISVVIQSSVQVGALLRCVASGKEINKAHPTLEEYLRDELPGVSVEAAQLMMEVADRYFESEKPLAPTVFCDLVDKAGVAWKLADFREVWPRFKEIMAEQMALAESA